jgi:hypothetical protein
MTWNPSNLGANLVAALDVGYAWAKTQCIWQDTGKTIPAVNVGDNIAAIVDPWSGVTWNFTGTTLAFANGQWGINQPTSGSAFYPYCTVSGLTNPFSIILRFKSADSSGNYSVPFIVGSNSYAMGYDNSGRLFSYTSTGFQSSGDVFDNNDHTLSAVVNGSSGLVRQDGTQLATGTNASLSSQTVLGAIP